MSRSMRRSSGSLGDTWVRRLSSRLTPFISRYAQFLLAGVALVVYLLTMPPGITWEHGGRDGGDFITAAWVLGVPHPTGYPTYTMPAWLFTRLPVGSVAWRVNLFSGVAGAACVAMIFVIGRRLASERESGLTLGGAAIGALLLAFAPLFWGHSIVAEVYALHLFIIALILWLMLRWRDGQGSLPVAALAFGVGMGNHITLAFLVPVILLLLWSGRNRLSWRAMILSVLGLLVGLSVYLYLPWRAEADPVINWGDPDNWENFRWMVTGQGYRRFFFALPRDQFGTRLQEWWNLTMDQFPWPAWLLAALGLWELRRRDGWLALGTALHAAISLIFALGYNTTDWFVNMLPLFLYAALWMGQGAMSLLAATERLGTKREPATIALRVVAACLILLPLLSVIQEWGEMDLTHERRADTFGQDALTVVEPGALIVVGADAYTFSLWYHRYVEQLRPDVVVVNEALVDFDWYQHTVAVHHPDVKAPGEDATGPTELEIVLRNMNERPVYLTNDVKDDGVWEGLELTQVGELWRVTAP